jgi:hypothetical protein
MKKAIFALVLLVLAVSLVFAAEKERPTNDEKNMTFGQCVSVAADARGGCFKAASEKRIACIDAAKNASADDKACKSDYKQDKKQCKMSFKSAKKECAKNYKPGFFEKMRYAFK